MNRSLQVTSQFLKKQSGIDGLDEWDKMKKDCFGNSIFGSFIGAAVAVITCVVIAPNLSGKDCAILVVLLGFVLGFLVTQKNYRSISLVYRKGKIIKSSAFWPYLLKLDKAHRSIRKQYGISEEERCVSLNKIDAALTDVWHEAHRQLGLVADDSECFTNADQLLAELAERHQAIRELEQSTVPFSH